MSVTAEQALGVAILEAAKAADPNRKRDDIKAPIIQDKGTYWRVKVTIYYRKKNTNGTIPVHKWYKIPKE